MTNVNGPFLKDPGDRLDYEVDFADDGQGGSWLGDDEIDSVEWTVPNGITNSATTADDTTAIIWLTGGTHGVDYTITCQATTTGGRIKQQSFVVKVRNNVA